MTLSRTGSVRIGKKKNRNTLSPNAQGVRRGAEDRAPKARGVSMQLVAALKLLVPSSLDPRPSYGAWGSAVSSPACPGGARLPNDVWCIFGLKMLYLARPR